jgi:hypothetical protein
MNAALGIANSLWWRARWRLIIALAYLCVLSIGVHVFPKGTPTFCTAAMAVVFMWANLLNIFSFEPGDIGAKESGFPAHMMVRPVQTKALVAWPMIYGIAISAGLWWLAIGLVLNPGGVHLPVFWPAILFAACMAWIQALAWTPLPSPWIRVLLLVAAIAPITALAIWGGGNHSNATVASWVLAAGMGWIGVAFAIGVLGLSRARCGAEAVWIQFFFQRATRWRRKRVDSSHLLLKPFQSAAAAQFWHEFRRNAVGVPVLIALASLPIMGCMVISLRMPDQPHGLVIHSMAVKTEVLNLGFLIFCPFLLVGMAGVGLGKFDYWGKERMTTLFAARPMTTPKYVLLKFKAAAMAAVASWGILLAVLLLWVALDVSPVNRHESLVRAAFAEVTPRSIAMVIFGCLGLLLLMWRSLVCGFWISLAGRKRVSTVVGISLPLIVFFVLPGLAEWMYRQPELRNQILVLVPAIVCTLAATKLCTAVAIGAFLKRLGLATERELAIAFAIWAIVAGCILATIGSFVPLTAILFGAVILVVPLARLAAAPLALYWNRHR